MGEMADMIMEEQMFDLFADERAERLQEQRLNALRRRIKNNAAKGIWVTAEREAMRVHDMTDGHLEKALAWAERTDGDFFKPAIEMFRAELKRRESFTYRVARIFSGSDT